MKQKAAVTDSLVGSLWADMQSTGFWTHVGAVILSLLLAWGLSAWLKRRWSAEGATQSASALVNGGLWRRGAFPLLAAVILQLCDWMLADLVRGNLVSIAKTLFFAMAIIRVLVYAAHRAVSWVELPKGTDTAISTLVWFFVAMHLLGWLDDLEGFLTSVSIPLGKSSLSLMTLLNGIFTTSITLLASLWLGASLESRLMGVQSIDVSFRVVIGRVMRAVLIVVAVLLSMSLAGIDLTILSVFGGALGVGLGLGMQRIASNYVSGFIILLDHSVRIGQPISVDKFSGVVSDIKTRYTVLKNSDGLQSVVPNEMLVSLPVTRSPAGARRTRDTVRISLAAVRDIDRLMTQLGDVVAQTDGVESSPAVQACVVDAGHDFFIIELAYWTAWEGAKTAALRSDVLIRIAAELKSTNVHFTTVIAKP